MICDFYVTRLQLHQCLKTGKLLEAFKSAYIMLRGAYVAPVFNDTLVIWKQFIP